ncbi:hypothetical protein QJS10_CPA09g01226 [Acorus calamus]|uniref:Uncharacterized protein n=1 Tax=Acorus calamus TaxID=4465 RepID=A0AAV9E342_ACOCL|nr:hypothetical protein QJS10_CPA09g01226 [Acorus calamus]
MDIKLAKNMVHAALMAMALAFGTGAYSVLVHRCSWAGTVVLVMACVFRTWTLFRAALLPRRVRSSATIAVTKEPGHTFESRGRNRSGEVLE